MVQSLDGGPEHRLVGVEFKRETEVKYIKNTSMPIINLAAPPTCDHKLFKTKQLAVLALRLHRENIIQPYTHIYHITLLDLGISCSSSGGI